MINRRQLIIGSVKFAALTPISLVAAHAWSADKKPAAKKPTAVKMVPANDPVASALKYVADATKTTRTDKMGVKGSAQTCNNCQLFTKQGNGYGKCTMFASGAVAEKGWCSAWVKKS